MRLPPDFFDLLKTAKKFTGPFAQRAPWQGHVILSNGKLYASNNRQIVEIECGVAGQAVFSASMIQIIETFGDKPSFATMGAETRFEWEDGRYVQIENDFDHDDVVAQFAQLLDDWHGKDGVATLDLGVEGRAIEVTDGPREVNGKLAPRGGFFYVSNGTPASRLIHGETDLRLDDLFGIRRKELEGARKANERKRDRLLDEQVRIERELARLKREIEADEQRLEAFEDSLDKFRRGETLDDEEQAHLQPACQSLIDREKNAELREAIEELPNLPRTIKGWERHGERSDGEYAYVTYRRELPKAKAPRVLRQRIESTVGIVFEPDFPREALVPAWKSLTEIQPRAGPI